MQRFTSPGAGRLMVVMGVVTALTLVFLLTYLVSYFRNIPALGFSGPLNDIFISVQGILFVVLAFMLIPAYGRRPLWIHIPLLVAALAGALTVIVDSRVMGTIHPGLRGAEFAIMLRFPFFRDHDLHFGLGMLGIWLMVVNYHAQQNGLWPQGLVALGFVASVVMMLGLAGFPSALGFVAVFPVWSILLGRWILRGGAAAQ